MMHITLKDGTEFSADKIEHGHMAESGEALYAIVKTGESDLAHAVVDCFKGEEIEKIEVEK